jgi:hypothetical protein
MFKFMGEVQCPVMDLTLAIDMLREYAVRLKEMVVQTRAASLRPRYTDDRVGDAERFGACADQVLSSLPSSSLSNRCALGIFSWKHLAHTHICHFLLWGQRCRTLQDVA